MIWTARGISYTLWGVEKKNVFFSCLQSCSSVYCTFTTQACVVGVTNKTCTVKAAWSVGAVGVLSTRILVTLIDVIITGVSVPARETVACAIDVVTWLGVVYVTGAVWLTFVAMHEVWTFCKKKAMTILYSFYTLPCSTPYCLYTLPCSLSNHIYTLPCSIPYCLYKLPCLKTILPLHIVMFHTILSLHIAMFHTTLPLHIATFHDILPLHTTFTGFVVEPMKPLCES